MDILVLTKNCVFISTNFKVINKQNAIQFNIISPGNTIYNVVGIYAPNWQKENFNFFNSLPGKIKKGDSDLQILTGNFNTTLDPNLDKTNYRGDEHIKT